ncbi:MAG TPA: aldo/keto reductase [Anaerolineaceae bacterium]|jgi:voltage-dependent potassium channel beta subunit|nr:aldo/keto reductase [Anaerolineaceae bacterium]HQJ33091.1 aldo/keto reductase [Anaerolineaceae bacterium]
MNYRNLGKSGLKLSELSFGSWVTYGNQVDLELAKKLMSAAWDHGVNFFDNAEAYAHGEAERVMGKALKELGWPREQFVVSTKIFWGGQTPTEKGLSFKHIVEGVDRSLRNFQLDHVDLVFAHRPDFETPVSETVRAFNHVIQQGKAFYWGTSEWPAERILEAAKFAEDNYLIGPTMEQPEYNLLHRSRFEEEYAILYKKLGLGTTTWSPLKSGMLSGKYRGGVFPEGTRANLPGFEWLKEMFSDPARMQAVENLALIADDLGVSLAQMSIAWLLKNPNVSTVITGASRLEQLEENFKALDVVDMLTDDVLDRIDDALANYPDDTAVN